MASAGGDQISADTHTLQASQIFGLLWYCYTDAHPYSSTSSGSFLPRSLPPTSLQYGQVTEWRLPLDDPLLLTSFLRFQSPSPGRALPMRTPPHSPSLPPWCDANTQPGRRGRAKETAVTRYHIGSTGTSGADPNRHNWDGSEWPTSFHSPAPRLGETTLPRCLARGRRRQGCYGGVAAPGGERRPPSGLARDRPRPRGPGLWGGAVRLLVGSRLPGGNDPSGRS